MITDRVRFESTAGTFHATVDRVLCESINPEAPARFILCFRDHFLNQRRSAAPLGVGRFLTLVQEGFFTDMLLYRVIPGFLIQFGVAADPEVMAKWDTPNTFPDELNRAMFEGGTLSYAGAGKDSRCCHFFVALEPNGAFSSPLVVTFCQRVPAGLLAHCFGHRSWRRVAAGQGQARGNFKTKPA